MASTSAPKVTVTSCWDFYLYQLESNKPYISKLFGNANSIFKFQALKVDDTVTFSLSLNESVSKNIAFELNFNHRLVKKSSSPVAATVYGVVSRDVPFTFVRDLSYYYSNFSLTFDDVKISNFFLDFNSSDITLKTSRDNGLFPAHKLVLSARSSVFAAMFSHGEVKENQNRLIEINDMSSEVMLAILKYIYTGDIEGYDYLYGDLLETARNVRGKECAQSMLRNLSVVNAARCFYLADLYDVQEIKKPIYEFINKNKEAFRLSDGWKQYFVPKIELIEKLFLTDYEDAGSEDDEKDGD